MQFYPLFPIIYRFLKPRFPQCLWSGNPNYKKIALTFDDGPHPVYTPQLLKVLDQYNIPVSFFWLGICVERLPHIAKEVHSRGHWIGLHGYDHAIGHNFPFLKAQAFQESLQKTQTAIYNACGLLPEKVIDVRPPNGLFTRKTLKLLQQWNYRPVMWSVVPEDWVRPGVNKVVNRVMKLVDNGAHIVLHDGYYGGADVAEIVSILVPLLLDRGYQFVTIDELWRNI